MNNTCRTRCRRLKMTRDIHADRIRKHESNSKTMSSQHEVRRKRAREIHSCIPCHQKKVKCDRATPCTYCTTRGRDTECIYSTYRKCDNAISDQGHNRDNTSSFRPSKPTTRLSKKTLSAEDEKESDQFSADAMFARSSKGKVKFKGPTHWSVLVAEVSV